MTTRRKGTPLQRLLHALWRVGAARDVDAICRQLTRETSALTAADGVAVYLWSADDGVVCAHARGVASGSDRALRRWMRKMTAGARGRAPRPRILSDATTQERWPDLAEAARREGWRAVAVFPLLLERRIIGMLVLLHRSARPYRPDERQVLEVIAHHAALALSSALLVEQSRHRADELQRMYDRLQEAYRHLQAFHDVGIELVASLDVHRVLQTVARYAAELTGSDAGGVFEYDPADGTLRVSAGHRASRAFEEGIRQARVTLGQGAIGQAALGGRPVQIPDIEAEPDYPFHPLVRAEGFRAILAVPMLAREELLGGLVVWRRTPGSFSPEQVQLLEGLARQSAVAIRNARLYAALEKAYDDTLEALTAALDVRDRDTEGHSRRVASLALAIGRELGLPPEQLQALYRGGLLHDIGKIGIPDRILHKPGPLDEEEWAVMRRHPSLGFKVLDGIEFLMAGSEVVLYHHERYDGKGYPMGLRGEAIPLVARVFAVADAYDAMTSPRPYRAPLDSRSAIEEIVRNAGSQFDPKVVRAFLRVVEAPGSGSNGTHPVSTPAP
ncbi:MAG TPA: HD domain-containing phosphohydrolase [Limnochordales bacterium]